MKFSVLYAITPKYLFPTFSATVINNPSSLLYTLHLSPRPGARFTIPNINIFQMILTISPLIPYS